jgi:FdhD protein
MTKSITVERSILKFDRNNIVMDVDEIATELPITIMLNGIEFATLVCTPEYLDEMVVGYLASEGIVKIYSKDIKSLHIDDSRGYAYVELTYKPNLNQGNYSKRFIGSCCGKSRQSFYFQSDVKTAKTSFSSSKISPEKCIELMQNMQEHSDVFKQTGGVHNAALCDTNHIILSRSDIGRHNALDKLYGFCLMNQMPIHDKILVFSGRMSSEILLKAAKIGVGILLSKSAPTDLALQAADELNITTVGFIRGEKLNIYTHPERIITYGEHKL